MRSYLHPCGLVVLAMLTLFACAPLIAHAQRPAPAATPPPQKKKTPPGAKGFELFAGRDASDKLITGAGTRGGVGAAQAAFDEGLKNYKAHDLTKAAAALERATKLAPKWAEAHYSLAIVLNELDRWDEAVVEFQRALDANPDENTRALAIYNQGNALLDLGRYDKALANFQQTAQLAPAAATPHYNMGMAYLGLKQPDQAVAEFKEAIRLKPGYADAHYNLGVLYHQRGRDNEARAEQQQLTKLNPTLARRLAALLKQ